MSCKVQVVAEIEIPRVPNFIFTASGQKLPLSAFEADDLRKLAILWGEALVDRAAEQNGHDGGCQP